MHENAEKSSSEGLLFRYSRLVMVGGDGGGRGRATVQMPRLLQFYCKVGAGGVWSTVEVRQLLKFG